MQTGGHLGRPTLPLDAMTAYRENNAMEDDTADQNPEPSTESSQPAESPRLGILHLMVLTACVAGYLGTIRGLQGLIGSDYPPVFQAFEATVGTLDGIAAGATLAGLILLAARRFRGMPFPVHPGEFLIVMLGIAVVMNLLRYAPYIWYVRGGVELLNDRYMWVAWGIGIGTFVLNVAWWIWAFVRLKARRWRRFLLLIPACHVVGVILSYVAAMTRPMAPILARPVAPVLISLALAIVAVRDHAEGHRYPWTHWFGVVIYYWRTVAMVIGCVWAFIERS